ncbi:MAG: patatin-like phospholipase family protein [Chloroflexota bacterium]|nr:patatin-like phospholipase family protein [Chloroflexota bacterium]
MTAPALSHRPAIAPDEGYAGPKRALILAGGGIRVAYQGGAVQALHEAGLRFDHADGASGGILNLAMLCSGHTPEEICRRWRTLDPKDSISLLPLHHYLRPHALPAMGDADGLVSKVFPRLGIDADRINAIDGMVATFNVCNYTRKTNVAFRHDEIDRDLLVAGVSLPIFLPAVKRGEELFLDSVWIKDANLMEAVRCGAEELWVVWCIGNAPEYHGGAFPQYVHMIEISANGALFEEFDRIAEINERIRKGDSPYGQTSPIRLHLIRPAYPLPLDPDYYLGHIDGSTLVAMGYADTVAYLDEMTEDGLPYIPDVTRMAATERGLTFREEMRGTFALGKDDPRTVAVSDDAEESAITLHLAVTIRDLDRFIADPSHTAELVGRIDLAPFGTDIPCRRGSFNLFVPAERPGETRMVYELGFAHNGRDYLFVGEKIIRDDPGFDLWEDTTTLFARLYEGRERSERIAGSGVLQLGPTDIGRLVRSLHVTGADSLTNRAAVTTRFGRFFLGELWDTYGFGSSATAIPASTGPGLEPQPTSGSSQLRFTERMKGFVAFDETDPVQGERDGRQNRIALMVHLTIRIDDTHRFAADPAHEAIAEGWVVCDALGGWLPVEHGTFNLFVDDGDPTRKRMRYRLPFRDAVGHPLTLTGFKTVENDAGFDLWRDTTTLAVQIQGGHSEANGETPAIAAGIIRIHPMDFLRQLTTFRTGGNTPADHAAAIGRFGRLWVSSIWKVYGPGTSNDAVRGTASGHESA